MSFSSRFGLDPAIAALRKALRNDQVAGTYLFLGPQGVGKTSLAMAFAQAAACLRPIPDPFDACGECDSCRRTLAGRQPEINLISPAGDQTQIWQFWDRDNKPGGILQHTLPFAPTIGRRRVYILERADTLNEAAANSLLKVLEEPPPYALFILLAPHAARMLPTILSRSQLVRLTPAPVPHLTRFLQQTVGLDEGRARTMAAYAEGRTGTALRLARNAAVQEEIGRAVALAQELVDAPPLRALRLAEGIRKLASGLKAHADTDTATPEPTSAGPAANEESGEPTSKEKVGRRQLGLVLELLSACYRDLLALRLGGPDAPIIHGDRRPELSRLAETRPAESWMQCLEALLLARRRVDQNASIPLLTDWLALKLVNA
jgi:DNA polymerase III subunit delta'